jgi:hypothetical protein
MDDLFESVGREKEASVKLDDFTDIVLELKVKIYFVMASFQALIKKKGRRY